MSKSNALDMRTIYVQAEPVPPEPVLEDFSEHQCAALWTNAQKRIRTLQDCDSAEYRAAEADRSACERLAKRREWNLHKPKSSGGSIESTVQGSSSPPLVLVNKSGPNSLRFTHIHDLRHGQPCLATFQGTRNLSLGRRYPEQKKYGEWRYTESGIGSNQPVVIKMDADGYIKLEDTSGDNELVLDVSFWKFVEGNTVNFVGGRSASATHNGGGRLWTINEDGTISPRQAPHLVLGQGAAELSAEELKGCWKCCCLPCGAAIFSISPRGHDDYVECGIFLFLFAVPIPYVKRRSKGRGRNTFVNNVDPNDVAAFLNDKTIDPGPFCLKGGRA